MPAGIPLGGRRRRAAPNPRPRTERRSPNRRQAVRRTRRLPHGGRQTDSSLGPSPARQMTALQPTLPSNAQPAPPDGAASEELKGAGAWSATSRGQHDGGGTAGRWVVWPRVAMGQVVPCTADVPSSKRRERLPAKASCRRRGPYGIIHCRARPPARQPRSGRAGPSRTSDLRYGSRPAQRRLSVCDPSIAAGLGRPEGGSSGSPRFVVRPLNLPTSPRSSSL